MKKVLVIGGTRFFGKKAVNLLLENGHDVTIATRGKTPHPFGKRVRHVILDAKDPMHSGWAELNEEWDAVFDNVCYTKEEAQILIDKFQKNTAHLHFTSTMSVYSGEQDGYTEEDFDPYTYRIDSKKAVDYGEGKRQAEAVLVNQDFFKVTFYRFPIVLDLDDYTQRLHFYIEKVLKREPIHFARATAYVNYVKGSTAADFIVWAIENEIDGIFNVAAKDAQPLSSIVRWLQEDLQEPVEVIYGDHEDIYSPFSVKHDQYLMTDKMTEAGFHVDFLEVWMRPLIKEIGAVLKEKIVN